MEDLNPSLPRAVPGVPAVGLPIRATRRKPNPDAPEFGPLPWRRECMQKALPGGTGKRLGERGAGIRRF